MQRFQWRKQYDIDDEIAHDVMTQVSTVGPTLTQEHYADDVNLNTIVKRFGIGDGAIPPAAMDPRYFGDFSDVPDFRQALDAVREATTRFNALPVELRNRFGNDPATLWQFVNDPNNLEESIKLGLLKRIDRPLDATRVDPTTTPTTEPGVS